jgi:hypothetical protein
MKFACQTLFDISATGITGHFKSMRLPYTDSTGKLITDSNDWNRARNQQRNWETLTQVISMRTQIFELLHPVKSRNVWSFEFEVENPGVFGNPHDPVGALLSDAEGVPMLVGLDNRPDLAPILITTGPEQNIWFIPISINN